MKTILKIWWLKAGIIKLKSKRKSAILEISQNQKKQASRVNTIEDVNPAYFKEIDEDIVAREKLISILTKDSLNNFRSISNTKP